MLIIKIAITTTAAILYLFIFFPVLRPYILPSPWKTTPSAIVLTDDGDANFGAVASESSICSTAGIDMLKRGGTAADAVSKLSRQAGITYTDLVKDGCNRFLCWSNW
jgi:gamma-glutamyltranspeptidase/glutathione hydrolase